MKEMQKSETRKCVKCGTLTENGDINNNGDYVCNHCVSRNWRR